MFTGIIQTTGTVVSYARYQKRDNLKIRSSAVAAAVAIGDSVSVDGVCLTVTRIARDVVVCDVLAQTASVSTLGTLRPGRKVNLEPSLKVGGPLGGHFVTGHVDCIGSMKRTTRQKNNVVLEIMIPTDYVRYFVKKGSVAVDGISLTVVDVMSHSFTVHIIAHTLQQTTLLSKKVGSRVNIECDILAKYAQRAMEPSRNSS